MRVQDTCYVHIMCVQRAYNANTIQMRCTHGALTTLHHLHRLAPGAVSVIHTTQQLFHLLQFAYCRTMLSVLAFGLLACYCVTVGDGVYGIASDIVLYVVLCVVLFLTW